MNILLCLSHSIEEENQVRLLSDLGYDVFSIGGYIDPHHPHDPKRNPVLTARQHPELKAVVDMLGQPDNLGAAQERIPDAILDWADVIIYHHQLDRLFRQWPRIKAWRDARDGRRVIWRSVGQSVASNEADALPFRAEGLERVAYSPKEANIPGYSGHDALIRFYADPDEWHGWTGEDARVLNIAQHAAQPHGRDHWLNWGFWEQATEGLPSVFAGPHSEKVGGLGTLGYDKMRAMLRSCRAYLYTGTQPASYTLGLIEAMMTGIPVVSIGPAHMTIFPYGPDLFEGHEIVGQWWEDDPAHVGGTLDLWLSSHDDAAYESRIIRARAIELFGKDTIARQWLAYLGSPVDVTWQTGVAVTA